MVQQGDDRGGVVHVSMQCAYWPHATNTNSVKGLPKWSSLSERESIGLRKCDEAAGTQRTEDTYSGKRSLR
jgi:hypothetical protein